jgi:hypothetical protein
VLAVKCAWQVVAHAARVQQVRDFTRLAIQLLCMKAQEEVHQQSVGGGVIAPKGVPQMHGVCMCVAGQVLHKEAGGGIDAKHRLCNVERVYASSQVCLAGSCPCSARAAGT